MQGLEDIYRERFYEVYWAAYAILRDDGRAQDAVQTVFLKALRHSYTILRLEEAQLRLWLYRAVRSACIDELRRIRRQSLIETAVEEDTADAAPLPQEIVESREAQGRMLGLIDALPDKYRRPILLYYYAEIPQREIAAMLGVKEATLRSHLRRGKAILYDRLMEGGGSDD